MCRLTARKEEAGTTCAVSQNLETGVLREGVELQCQGTERWGSLGLGELLASGDAESCDSRP